MDAADGVVGVETTVAGALVYLAADVGLTVAMLGMAAVVRLSAQDTSLLLPPIILQVGSIMSRLTFIRDLGTKGVASTL